MLLSLLAVHGLRLATLMLQRLTLQASSQLLLEAEWGCCIIADSDLDPLAEACTLCHQQTLLSADHAAAAHKEQHH